MRSSFKYCLALVSITLVGGIVSSNFREDYCELFLNSSKISDKSCHKNGSHIVTNEYELKLTSSSRSSHLVLKWTKDNLTEWNSVAITNIIQRFTSLKVLGIRSLEDHRLRPASFYLNKLIIEYVDKFEINAEQFLIYETNSQFEMGSRLLHIDFKRSVHLGQINDYVAAGTKRIEKLRIKGLHIPGTDLCTYAQFLSLPELQENVEELSMDVNMTVNMKCFENYRKLKFIFTDTPYEPFENLTALICTNWLAICNFTMGRNGLRCPANCECTHEVMFKIDCRNKKNTQIPPLPIPIDYRIELIYSGMQLIQLPNNTLPGYMEVTTLDVSDNKISSLVVHQLPRKLDEFDISNNPITTIDNKVVNYLKRHFTNVLQRGIQWIANCDERYLVKMLQEWSYWELVFFQKLNGECHFKCQCCFDKKTENFVIDCSSKAVIYGAVDFKDDNYILPKKNVPNKVTFLLGNRSMKEFPKSLPSFMKAYNVSHLDLRKNVLKSLNEETLDFFKNHVNTTIELSGNPWSCTCKPRSFLFFLKTRSPAEYRLALARCQISKCPDSCVCCLDNLKSSSLKVDCRGQRLRQFPLLPDSVTSLDLRDNSVTEINKQSQTFLSNILLSGQLTVYLSGNPWDCTCELFSNAKNISSLIQDFTAMECSNLGKRLALVEDSEVCPSYFIYYVLLFVFSMTIITVLNAFVYFKQPILMWFYEHEICMSMAVRMDLERTKKFDAFLCFTHKDENLIEDYVERLENGQRKFRLCFYLRDWNIGASIPDCIIQSVNDSRRIIILMTKNFLESTWGKLEFRLALHATTKDRCKRLIVIVYPDVENFDDLDSELKAYMVLNTYLRRDNPNFWNKLVYSMPHIS